MPDVRISLNGGQISVDKDKVSVSKSAHETVTWASNDGQFAIKFAPGSGIPDPTITQQGTGNTWQGTGGPYSTEGSFKYDVTSPGFPDLDPTLDIKP